MSGAKSLEILTVIKKSEEETSKTEATAEIEAMLNALGVTREAITHVIARSEDEVDQDLLDPGQEIEETEEEEAEEVDLEIGMKAPDGMIGTEAEDHHHLPDQLREIEAEEIEEIGIVTMIEEIETDTMTTIEDVQELIEGMTLEIELIEEMTLETEMIELIDIGPSLQEALTIEAKVEAQARRATIETILSDLEAHTEAEVLDLITSLKEPRMETRWKTMGQLWVKILTTMLTLLDQEKLMMCTTMIKSQTNKIITMSDRLFELKSI